MAEVLAVRYEFLQNNPAGTFLAGDIVEVYLEENEVDVISYLYLLDAGAKVYHNGSLITSGVNFPMNLEIYYISIVNYGSFCVGTVLISPGPAFFFPYVSYINLKDYYSCAVNPPTCNLIIVGSPTVTPASGAYSADGAISVSATSSKTIQYNLNSDFVYGAGQTNSTFSGLLPGQYRVFLRDSANCGVNTIVTIPFTNGYGTIFRLEYDDLAGYTTKIDITKRGYSGSVSEIKGSGSPFILSLTGEGETDKFTSVLPSKATLNLTSETEGFFSDLYTNDRNLFRVDYYKDFGSGYELLWKGKLLPFNYQEQIKASPYYLSVAASDGLPELKDLYLIHQDGQKFFGTVSLIKLIAYCLSFLKLDLNIMVACNLYATTMNTADTDDPLDQAYIDYETFYLATDQPSLMFVLSSVLDAFNVRIIQWQNKWNIVRTEEVGDTIAYREFNSLGDYSSNSTINLLKDVQYPNQGGIMWTSFPNRELRKGYGTIKVNYKLGLKPNVFNNGDFSLKSVFVGNNQYSFTINKDDFTIYKANYSLTEGFERIDDGGVALVITGGESMLTNSLGGSAYVQTAAYFVKMGSNNQIKINIRYKVNRVSAIFSNTVYKIEVPYVKVRMAVQYNSLYLQGDGTWSTAVSTVDFFVTTFNEYQESEIVAQQPTSQTPVSGMYMTVRLYHAYGYYAQFGSIAALQGFSTYSASQQVIPTGYKTELRDTFTPYPTYIYFYELEETTASASGYDIIRPTDYHAANNPRQWVKKYRSIVGTVSGANVFGFAIDRIQGTFLTDGKEPIDTIIRKATAEPLNKEVFEKDLIIGSYSSFITTETNFSPSLGIWFPDSSGGISITTTNVLSADLIYTGWLRSSSGDGYEYWARDGVSEEAKLHAIWLTSYASQYSRSWELLRGTLTGRNVYFGLLNVLSETNNSDKVYLPISLDIDDFRNEVSGEFLEMIGLTGGAGFPSSPGSPFTSGFSTGFGASGFN